MRVLVFACSHISPGQDLTRFNLLGSFVSRAKPAVVINLGDFVHMDSLSPWDKNRRATMENRRYKEDIDVGREAWERFSTPWLRGPHIPEYVYCLGNHEERVIRYCDEFPEMKGKLDVVEDLKLPHGRLKITVVPYRKYYNLHGVSFTHAIMGANNKPMGGSNASSRVIDLISGSVVFGHTHRLENTNKIRHGSSLIKALSVGTFSEHTDEYADGGLNHYWRGCVMLTLLGDGQFDYTTLDIRRLKDGSLLSCNTI